ncbi:MarR family winged helix-turn-helix transcriptional regulator [Georgenia sp. Z1491]|uniref:MarR family winged helix-turn-helix transcriptional regulator n=1 Tax=Georgenia sp. Z1491 TaxID=3416707 RepID=UPI003CF97E3E
MEERGTDEVDRIVAAWRRERPDLDVAPLEVFSRVTRLARHLDLARRRALAGPDLEIWQFDVLSALRRAGAPYRLTPTRLVAETLVSSGTMTHRIDKMVAAGLVERTQDDADKRVVHVRLTEEGLARVDRTMTDLLDAERGLLAQTSPRDAEALADLLRSLTAQFEPDRTERH